MRRVYAFPILLVVLATTLASCVQLREEHPLCEALKTSDRAVVADWVDHLAGDLDPVATTEDPVGHEENIETLLDRLNDLDCVSAALGCYACIETLPPKSEIILRTDHLQRIVFLRTGSDSPMRFAGWRE